MSSFINKHKNQQASYNADQVEFNALIHGSSVFDEGLQDEKIADVMLPEGDPEYVLDQGMADWGMDDVEVEEEVNNLYREIEFRKKVLGELYPYEVSGGSLVYKETQLKLYEMLLIISVTRSFGGDNGRLPSLFELISGVLSATIFGQNNCFLHTGWPRTDDKLVRFRDLMGRLNSMSGEWSWRPAEFLDEDPSHVHIKDNGMDFVCWLDFGDSRGGKPFIVGQCACGNNWLEKLYDLDIKAMKDWFSPMTYVEPIKAFSVPFCIANGMLEDVTRKAGILLDRIRLMKLAQSLYETAPERFLLHDEIREHVAKRFS